MYQQRKSVANALVVAPAHSSLFRRARQAGGAPVMVECLEKKTTLMAKVKSHTLETLDSAKGFSFWYPLTNCSLALPKRYFWMSQKETTNKAPFLFFLSTMVYKVTV